MGCTQFNEDGDYVLALRTGGAQYELATDCLYRRYRNDVLGRLERYVGYLSGQHDEMKDLVQDAFIIMTEKITGGGYNDGSLVHFWLGIAKGILRNKVKRDARTDLIEDSLQFDEVATESPETELLDKERKAILDALLDKVGGRCKNVMLMWANGYSMPEITDKLGFSSEVMARKTKFKCKEKLVQLVKDFPTSM